MIRLQANAQYAPLADRVSTSCHVADLRGGDDKVLIAHQLCDGRSNFRSERPLQALEVVFVGVVGKDPLAQFAYGPACDGPKAIVVVRVEYQSADFIRVWINERLIEDFAKRYVGERHLGGDSFALGLCSNARKLIAGLLLVGSPEKVA